VVGYNAQRFEEVARDVDAALDGVSMENVVRSFHELAGSSWRYLVARVWSVICRTGVLALWLREAEELLGIGNRSTPASTHAGRAAERARDRRGLSHPVLPGVEPGEDTGLPHEPVPRKPLDPRAVRSMHMKKDATIGSPKYPSDSDEDYFPSL
jgi:hypothetical protein